MAWLVKLVKDGASVSGGGTFDTVYEAVEAGNTALRNDNADDVTIANREREQIYYQFGTVRTTSEELHIARMLKAELVIADRG